VVIAAQFAKLVKIGCGHEQTHVSSSKLDLKCLGEWLRNRPALSPLSSTALLADSAREVLITSGYDAGLIAVVAGKAADAAALMAPGIEITVFLAGYHGEMLYCAERPSE
jgi:cobalt-precorrin-5B (C1)-methyltransferase